MWVERGEGHVLRLQRIGASDRQTYIEGFTGSKTDPFASPADKDTTYITFLVEVENNGERELVFQPKNCWLVTDKKEVGRPIGMDDLTATFGMLDQEITPAYEEARSAILAETRFIKPGERLSGLLVYRSFERRAKRFQVDLLLTSANGELIKLAAHYRRLKKHKKKS